MTPPMTDDLVGRLRRWCQNTGYDGGPTSPPMLAIARIAELEGALERCAVIVERNLYRQHEKIEYVPKIARAALAKDKSDG